MQVRDADDQPLHGRVGLPGADGDAGPRKAAFCARATSHSTVSSLPQACMAPHTQLTPPSTTRTPSPQLKVPHATATFKYHSGAGIYTVKQVKVPLAGKAAQEAQEQAGRVGAPAACRGCPAPSLAKRGPNDSCWQKSTCLT